MPITIGSKIYTDIFGVQKTFYQANAGDKTTVEINLTESISVLSSPTQILTREPVNNVVGWTTGNFLTEGFRIGDTAIFRKFVASGALLTSWSTLVTNVSATELDVVSLPTWYDYTVNESLSITVDVRKRESMVLNLNHVLNGGTGSKFSLIDGEVTAFTFDLNAYLNGATYVGVPVGIPSGQFACTAEILDATNYLSGTDVRVYKLTLEIIHSGLYEPNNYNASGCEKLFIGMDWQSLQGEPYNNLSFIISDDADTGWFNQAFNTGVINATLLQGIPELDYTLPTSGQVIIDSASVYFGFGSGYISTDENYYKNRPFNQSVLTMIIPTSEFVLGVPQTSILNEFGAGYDLQIDSISTLGTVHTIDFTFTPNAQFADFMNNREDGDRLFYIWSKYGNVNLLLFQEQAQTVPPVGGFLTTVNNQFHDHSINLTTETIGESSNSANIEDDLAFTGQFLIDKNAEYQGITIKIEAFNSVTNEDFTLQSVYFDFASVPFNGIKHLLNLSQPIISQLPTTSEKRIALCELNDSIDTVNQYGIHLYYPFINRWEYWLQQLNASIDFYPGGQTKNWFPYDSTTDWTVRLKIEAVKNGLAYLFIDDLEIKDYDSEPVIEQEIELIIDATNTTVGVVVENQLMRIVATHTLLDLSAWNPGDIWGMITVEPTESSPRHILSTVIPFDFNPLNPLTPLSGSLISITFPAPNIARMECYFDPNKVNLANGCKFTTKVKGCVGGEYFNVKHTTDSVLKETTDGQSKFIA